MLLNTVAGGMEEYHQTNDTRKYEHLHKKEWTWILFTSINKKINFEWFKHLNVIYKIMESLHRRFQTL